MTKCPVCGRGGAKSEDRQCGDRLEVTCDSCGDFTLAKSTASLFWDDARWGGESTRARAMASSYLRESGATEPLVPEDLEKLLDVPEPTREERGLKVLRGLQRLSRGSGSAVDYRSDENRMYLLASGWCEALWELEAVLGDLRQEGYVRDESGNWRVSVTLRGERWLRNDGRPNLTSRFGFIAMCFKKEMDLASNAIRAAMGAAGYTGQRVDDRYVSGKIDEEILGQIRRSRFVVADLTHIRGGVYFEAGYAMSLRIPLILTCRTDFFGERHFDLSTHGTIEWAKPEDLEAQLKPAILATVGQYQGSRL